MKRPIRRILLVFPSMIYKRLQSRKTAIPPVGLAGMAAVLEDNYEVRILDSSLEGFSNEVDQPNGLSSYGLSDEAYLKAFSDYQPDVVGISCLFSSLHTQALRAARLAKLADPNVITVMGGPHPSALPETMLADDAVDYVVIGEGERPFSALLRCLETGTSPDNLPALASKRDGRVHVNRELELLADLDQLPLPAWHLLDLERYFNIGSVQGLRMDGKQNKALRIMQVTTSRGCPYACTYCGKYAVWGSRIRFLGADRVVETIGALYDRYGTERIAFQDDNLTQNKPRALELFDKLARQKWPITWEAHNGLALSCLDEEVLDAMAASGCVSFTVAVESGSPEVLERIRKHVDLERAIELAEYARGIGLDIRAFYIIGFPGETRAQIEATREHLRRMRASVSALAIYTPLPGSPLYDELAAQGVLDTTTLDFESLTFGAFDQQLSEVSIPDLNRIRKIDWLMNVFADPLGNLKPDLAVDPRIVFKELAAGLEAYPDAAELRKLHAHALKMYTGPNLPAIEP